MRMDYIEYCKHPYVVYEGSLYDEENVYNLRDSLGSFLASGFSFKLLLMAPDSSVISFLVAVPI